MKLYPQRRRNALDERDIEILGYSSVKPPESSEYLETPLPIAARQPIKTDSWKKRFRGADGEPLPPDYTRVDVGTGQIIERVKEDR